MEFIKDGLYTKTVFIACCDIASAKTLCTTAMASIDLPPNRGDERDVQYNFNSGIGDAWVALKDNQADYRHVGVNIAGSSSGAEAPIALLEAYSTENEVNRGTFKRMVDAIQTIAKAQNVPIFTAKECYNKITTPRRRSK
jgi:hypothetical protein